MSVLRMSADEVARINAKNRAARKLGTPDAQNARRLARITQASTERGQAYPDTPETRQRPLKRPHYEQMLAEQCLAAGLPAFIMEYRFDAVRDWRIDLAWPPRLAVEIDGAVHRIKARFAGDLEKHQALFFAGWPLLRVSTAQVRDGSAVALIQRALGILR